MLTDFLFSCLFLMVFITFLLLLRRNIIEILVTICSKKELIWLGFRKWEYYEDSFGSGDEKTNIHIRICQYTHITEVYDYSKKKFVSYNE